MIIENIVQSVVSDKDDLDTEDEHAQEIADAWLDIAIARKKSGRINDCIEAHVQRMRVVPHYKTTDAIRLLGIDEDSLAVVGDDDHRRARIAEISCKGLFEIHDSHDRKAPTKFTPSREAADLGNRVKEFFFSLGYRLQACQSFLLPYIQDGDTTNTNGKRIFSAQSFLQHRHEVFHARRSRCGFSTQNDVADPPLLGELEILVWMFLFGLAVQRREAVEVLGSTSVDMLIQAKLLRRSPIDPDSMLVAEVQIYPIDIGVFVWDDDDHLKEAPHQTVETFGLFLTDWNLESLRQTHSAVMSVGYDTLELLALTAGEMARQRQVLLDDAQHNEKRLLSQGSSSNKRILDLCCGCGIQGIFAWLCYKACVAPLVEEETCELVLTDINRRALHFVTANLAINGVTVMSNNAHNNRSKENNRSCNEYAFGLCGDPFEPLTAPQQTFDLIVCNPPFVAIPSRMDATFHEKTPLYGVGGGLDGMMCLRRILESLYRFLSRQNTKAMALMVTEVPNVEESPTMLSSFLSELDREEARIRVAYVEDDVETMEAYVYERNVETGIDADGHADDYQKEWLPSALASGIQNRALVLISFARSVTCKTDQENWALFNFQSSLENGSKKLCSDEGESYICQADLVDEEDMFLHKTGMDFARKALLFSE